MFLILQDSLDDQLQKQYQDMCQEGDNTLFGIAILITHMTWILLKKVQEIISDFGLDFTLMSSFGTIEMWSYGIWYYSMLPINEDWSLKF